MKMLWTCLLLAISVVTHAQSPRPNIVYILCDDLGYGDVQCLNPDHGLIETSHLDRLASEGMTFTDSHSGSAVCTPTRYGIMTGRYAWRTKLQQGVVQGFAPSLIAADRPTVASFLQSQGYATAAIGKWHLNQQYLDPSTGAMLKKKDHAQPPVGATIPDGPTHRGFDWFHGFHHAGNMRAVIENDRVIADEPEITMLPRLMRKSVEYLAGRKGNPQPFFLYVPLSAPHTPIVPAPEWSSRSPLGKYADFVMQTDHVIGEIMKALDEHGFRDNTLVVVTSDNGCSKAAGIAELAEQGHWVSAGLRGSKADLWDGGHRVPFFVRWPGHVEPGSRCEQVICHVDLFATVADLLQAKTPDDSCEDSVSFLPALSGERIDSSRSGIVHHSNQGYFAYRMGHWKLLLSRGSGGWSSPRENEIDAGSPDLQLYDMTSDLGESKNLADQRPEVVNRMLEQLQQDVYSGRSTAGPPSANDVDDAAIVLWKNRKNETER